MMATVDNLIRISNLKKSIKTQDDEINILNGVNLIIKPGERVAILGASGSGKSTLLTIMAGLDLPSSGEVLFKSSNIPQMSESERANMRRTSIGFIFQTFQLLPSLTALENVMLPLEIQSLPYKLCKERAIACLESVLLAKRLNHYPSEMSGGEQQRVAIARAFITNPEIILADEMTGNLDTKTAERVVSLLFSLNKHNKTTLILVTHELDLARKCDRYLELKDGVLNQC